MGLVTLLSETSVLLASGGQSTELTFIVLLGNDPVDSRILLDGVVSGVDEDNLVEFVGGILTNPVGVEDSQVGAVSADLLLSNRSVRSGLLELSDTLMDGLTVDDTLADSSLSATSSNADSVDSVSLLGLESDSSGLVKSGRLGGLVDGGELSVLPASDTHDKSHGIGLLLSPKFL